MLTGECVDLYCTVLVLLQLGPLYFFYKIQTIKATII